jgi:hypothetical protein
MAENISVGQSSGNSLAFSIRTPSYGRFAAVGALGGLCSFFLSRLLAAGPFATQPVYFDLPGELLFGACAALFGVYLLTASDVTAPRTLVFALACGIFWSPVFSGIQASFNQYSTNQNAAGNAQQASSLASQIKSQTGSEAENTITTASSKVTDALTQLPSVTSASSKQAVVNSSTQVVNSIPVTQASTASVDALKNIGVASMKAGTPQVTALTVRRLQEIASQAQTPATKSAALQAAQMIAKQAQR